MRYTSFLSLIFLLNTQCAISETIPVDGGLQQLLLELPKQQSQISLEELEAQLKGAGLRGWLHAAAHDYDQYVFTYRAPGNFFDHHEFPLLAENLEVQKILKASTRHDEVILKGSFAKNKAPIRHIEVTEISVVKKHEDSLSQGAYTHKAKLPDELLQATELVGKVHAVADNGKILVVEYKDAVVPVIIPQAELTKDLFRNDKVTLKIKTKTHPKQPTHVILDVSKPQSLTVTDKIVTWHGKPGSITGTLVLFPKSPQVLFNVFALEQTDNQGVSREFTLVHFDDPKTFEKIRNKLQELWDQAPAASRVEIRNKYTNLALKVKATGTFNVVDPGQANPQILLTGPDQIEVVK